MAGIALPGQKYYSGGFYGTAQEHAARQKQQREQAPYDAAAASPKTATTAAHQVNATNPNLDYNVSPTGQTSISNQSEQARKMAELQAKLAADQKEKDRQSLLSTLYQLPSAPAATITHPGAGTSEADARAAAFSRAKDQAGQLARASLTSIAEEMAGRGISGSGMEALRSAGSIYTNAEAPLQELTRDQMLSDFERAAQIADMQYQGGITQRGQDLANRQSYLSLLAGLY